MRCFPWLVHAPFLGDQYCTEINQINQSNLAVLHNSQPCVTASQVFNCHGTIPRTLLRDLELKEVNCCL